MRCRRPCRMRSARQKQRHVRIRREDLPVEFGRIGPPDFTESANVLARYFLNTTCTFTLTLPLLCRKMENGKWNRRQHDHSSKKEG